MKRTLLAISVLACSCVLASAQARLVTSVTAEGIQVSLVRTEIFPIDTVTVTVVGDVMMHSAQLANCHMRYMRETPARDISAEDRDDPAQYDFTPCLAGIKDILSSADICIANMEFTLAGPPFTGYPAFSAPDSYAGYIARSGVDVFLTANNHIFDRGSAGALRTTGVYDGMEGISHTGCFADSVSMKAGLPLILDCRGIKVGIVNFTYGTNVPPTAEYPKVCRIGSDEIAAALRTARDSADVVIALPHWGIEYELHHSDRQEDVTDFLFRHGADAVIGSHPHVVEDVEIRDRIPDRKVPVVYSLGNIISNMSADNTQIGLIVTLPIVRYSDGRVRVAEPRYTLTWCSRPGGLTDCHVTVPVRDWIDRRAEWTDPYDYDRMISTYNRIKSTSGIQE